MSEHEGPQDTLQRRLDDIVSGRSAAARRAAAEGGLESAAAKAEPTPELPFSPFIFEDVQEATRLASEMMRVAEDAGGGDEGLHAALGHAEGRLAEERGGGARFRGGLESAEAAPAPAPAPPGLTQHAVTLFVTHYPPARQRLRLGTMEQRQPRAVEPSGGLESAEAGAEDASPARPPKAEPPEDRVSYWREDPLVNEHHEHWHTVYPFSGRPNPGGIPVLGSRQEELFGYMHEQMLARYDAERLAAGLARVEAFETYTDPIPQGYDPGSLALWNGSGWQVFGPRPKDTKWSDLTSGRLAQRPGAKVADQQEFFRRVSRAGSSGVFDLLTPPVKVDDRGENLGGAEEAGIGSPDYYGQGDARNFRTYGNHHNDGHIHTGAWNDYDPKMQVGPMWSTATALRDPFFWRWHKEVDAAFATHRDRLEPYDFAADAPPVFIGKEGAFSADIVVLRRTGEGEVDEAEAARAAFGEGGAGVARADELRTEMRRRTVTLQDESGRPVRREIEFVNHEDFLYAFRVRNRSGAPQELAVRVFLAPETLVEDRTAWIEMDRFAWRLEGEAGVVVRRSEDASVVRKPALKANDLTDDAPTPSSLDTAWCDCGWPYTMLLPRGTEAGMAFRLFVMFTSGADLSGPARPGKCTSVSYCGLKDAEYPDVRDLGYPFNRRFAASISETVAAHDHMAWTTLSIRCVHALPAPAAVVDTAALREVGTPAEEGV